MEYSRFQNASLHLGLGSSQLFFSLKRNSTICNCLVKWVSGFGKLKIIFCYLTTASQMGVIAAQNIGQHHGDSQSSKLHCHSANFSVILRLANCSSSSYHSSFVHCLSFFAVHNFHLQVNGSSEVLAGIDSLVTKLLLDSQNLVELCETLRSCWSTGLDLSGSETN